MKIKNKILTIFLVVLSVLFLFSGISKADTIIEYGGKKFPAFPEEYNNAKYKMIYYNKNSGKYHIMYFNDGDKPYVSNGVLYYPIVNMWGWLPTAAIGDTYYTWHQWHKNLTGNLTSLDDATIIIYSNFDIWNRDNNTLFFPRTPFLVSSNTQLELGGSIWRRVPALLLSILVFLVSFIGLQKAFRGLFRLLRRA